MEIPDKTPSPAVRRLGILGLALGLFFLYVGRTDHGNALTSVYGPLLCMALGLYTARRYHLDQKDKVRQNQDLKD